LVGALPDEHLLVDRIVAEAPLEWIGVYGVCDPIAEAVDRPRLINAQPALGQGRRRLCSSDVCGGIITPRQMTALQGRSALRWWP
jgi:hypothetical protein